MVLTAPSYRSITEYINDRTDRWMDGHWNGVGSPVLSQHDQVHPRQDGWMLKWHWQSRLISVWPSTSVAGWMDRRTDVEMALTVPSYLSMTKYIHGGTAEMNRVKKMRKNVKDFIKSFKSNDQVPSNSRCVGSLHHISYFRCVHASL